ncbi:MAG: DUF1364 domain-containing protein [Caldilineaceae bacterium]|nr:DUF1364 domain-containing protein [Caldilineaceae bacterium]
MKIDLRKLAKGQDCQLRIPGVCNHNPETTVLAHLRMAGAGGAGSKPRNLIGIHCCSACHDILDGRTDAYGKLWRHDERPLDILHGLIRTLDVVSRSIDL